MARETINVQKYFFLFYFGFLLSIQLIGSCCCGNTRIKMVDNDTAINDVNNNDREEEIAENDPLSFNSFSRSFDNSSLLSLELNEVIK